MASVLAPLAPEDGGDADSALASPVDHASLESDQANAAREWRQAVRQYALSRRPAATFVSPRARRWAWLLALAFHVLMVVLARLTFFPKQPALQASIVQVRLLDPERITPELPLPSPASKPQLPNRALRAEPHTRGLKIVAPEPATKVPDLSDVPDVRAYNPDGSVNLPDDFAEQLDKARPKPNFIPLQIVPSPLLAAKRPLKVRPNHFAQYWNGTDGMPLHESVWRYVTASKEFVAPWGGHYGCTWILILVACADIPDKPWNPPQTWKPATEMDEH